MSYTALTLRLRMLGPLIRVVATGVTAIALIVFRTDIVSAFDSAACFVGAC